MLTDDLFRSSEQYQATNLPTEIEARWHLVETSWKLCLPRQVLTVSPDPEPRNGRTLSLVYPARSNVTKIAFQRPIENEESTDH